MPLLVLPMRRTDRNLPLLASSGRSQIRCKERTLDVLTIGVGAGVVGVVVPAAGCVVEHLDDHLAVPLVEEGELAAGLESEVAGQLVPPYVQVYLALPLEQDLDRPPAEVAAGLP